MRIPAWVLEAYPELSNIISWLNVLKELWAQYQNVVILIGLIWVVRQLRRERINLDNRVTTLGQLLRASQEEAELKVSQIQQQDSSPPAVASQPQNYWEDMRVSWRNVRDRIELLIEKIPRQRTRSKYSRIARYSYRDVINSLQTDGYLRPTVAENLRSMDLLFSTFKFKPMKFGPTEFAQFRHSLDLVDGVLPDLEDDDSPSPAPVALPQVQTQAA